MNAVAPAITLSIYVFVGRVLDKVFVRHFQAGVMMRQVWLPYPRVHVLPRVVADQVQIRVCRGPRCRNWNCRGEST
jgi:hypothetical protein